MSHARFYAVGLVVVYCLLVSAVFGYSCLRIVSLDAQNGIDYSYYLQSYADDLSAKSFHESVHFPGVGTAMFFQGPDGRESIQKSIHFEPIKYLLALWYQIFQSPYALYAACIFIFYLPLLYGAWLILSRSPPFKYQPLLLFFLLLLYALLPGALPQAIAETRPFTFVFPVYLMFSIALITRRPLPEKLFLLNVLLAIREEMLILAVPAIAYEYLQERAEKASHRESGLMLASWLMWFFLAVVYLFYIHTAYSIAFTHPTGFIGKVVRFCTSNPVALAMEFTLGIAFLFFAAPTLWRRYIGRDLRRIAACVLVVGSLIPVIDSFIVVSPGLWPPFFIFNRYGYMICVVGIVCVLAIAAVMPPLPTRVLAWIGISSLFLCVIPQILTSKSPFIHAVVMEHEVQDSRLVFDARATLPHSRSVLVDIRTMQLFYDFSTVSVLVPRPAYVVLNPQDYYPDDARKFEGLLRSRPVDIVVQNTSDAAVESIGHAAGRKLAILEQNGTYTWYEAQ
jgi:hypothetical protein